MVAMEVFGHLALGGHRRGAAVRAELAALRPSSTADQRRADSSTVEPGRGPSAEPPRRARLHRHEQHELPARADVVIVGAGHNGLVAAILLARAGLDVWCWRRPT